MNNPLSVPETTTATPNQWTTYTVTNSDDIVFVKLEGKQYAMSQVLAPLINRGDLEVAWQVLRKIAEIEV